MTIHNHEKHIKIVAITSAPVSILEGADVKNLKSRFVDIYLHGEGENGVDNKMDLGAYYSKIIMGDEEVAIIDKGLLLALIDTAKRSTDLEAVYDDVNGTSYQWSTVDSLIIFA